MRTFGVRSPTPSPADVGCPCGCLMLVAIAAFWVLVAYFVGELLGDLSRLLGAA